MQTHIINLASRYYPQSLFNVHPPPAKLYVRGNVEILDHQGLAVVGSRLASPYGKQVTHQLVTEVAWASIVIISGLAFGIDSLAHQAALAIKGKTIAVLPGGIERIYPASHQKLAEQIINKGGALISEYPGNERPRKYTFVARNRLIAGLAQATLIIEAARNSGALHTAQFALEAGKEVMAIPGSIFSQTSVGTHQLIRDGAQLVQDSQDILEHFHNPQPPKSGDPQEQAIIDLLKQGGLTFGSLIDATGLSVSELSLPLSRLELAGKIRLVVNNYQLIKS